MPLIKKPSGPTLGSMYVVKTDKGFYKRGVDTEKVQYVVLKQQALKFLSIDSAQKIVDKLGGVIEVCRDERGRP